MLPEEDCALGLTVGAAAPERELSAAVTHLGVTREEVDRLCAAVLDVLGSAQGPVGPAAIRKELGPGVRSLGEAGRKRGTSTTLPIATGCCRRAD